MTVVKVKLDKSEDVAFGEVNSLDAGILEEAAIQAHELFCDCIEPMCPSLKDWRAEAFKSRTVSYPTKKESLDFLFGYSEITVIKKRNTEK